MTGGVIYGIDSSETLTNRSHGAGASLYNAGTARYCGTLGNAAIQTTDYTLPRTTEDGVARIGTTQYPTLQKAFEAAAAGTVSKPTEVVLLKKYYNP